MSQHGHVSSSRTETTAATIGEGMGGPQQLRASRCRFLELPIELRTLIYHYVFDGIQYQIC